MGAPLNPVPQVLKCFMWGWIDNEQLEKWGNVLHFGYSGGPPTGNDLALLSSQIGVQWSAHMAAECPAPTSLVEVILTDLTSPTSSEGSYFINANGTRGDDSIPANSAVLVSYPSPVRYRGGHPRSYLYAGGNADLEGAGKWSSLFTQEVQTHWQQFLQACLGLHDGATTLASFGFVRYHGKYAPNGGPPHYYLDTPVFSSISPSTATAHQQIASQRRRVGREKK